MAFHVRNIATAKAKTAFSRGAAIVTNNKENRVTLYTMKYNAADYNSAKVMSYPANIKFGEFKRRCSEKMSCTVLSSLLLVMTSCTFSSITFVFSSFFIIVFSATITSSSSFSSTTSTDLDCPHPMLSVTHYRYVWQTQLWCW